MMTSQSSEKFTRTCNRTWFMWYRNKERLELGRKDWPYSWQDMVDRLSRQIEIQILTDPRPLTRILRRSGE